jgi:hypothetical protein
MRQTSRLASRRPRRSATALLVALIALGGAAAVGAPGAFAGGPPVQMLQSAQPSTISPGGSTVDTITVVNNTASTLSDVFVYSLSVSGPGFVDIDTTHTTQGSCSDSEGIECDLGDIAPGASASVLGTIVADSEASTPDTITVDTSASYDATSVSADPLAISVVSTPPVGSASGFVPAGGRLSTGAKPSPGANDTVVLFKLAKQSAGTAMSLSTSPCTPLDCFGHIVHFTPFTGTSDPRHPARIRIRWDPSVIGPGLASNLYENPDGDPTQTIIPACVRVHGAIQQSPCVQKKRILGNGVLQFTVFVLSGDPSMRRR